MLRRAFYLYFAICVIMVATSFYTGRRATKLSGQEHYMLTTTSVLIDEEVPPESDADAAFDAAMREAGESTAIPVERKVFVLGFADATVPVIILGGLGLLIGRWFAQWRTRRAIGPLPRQGL